MLNKLYKWQIHIWKKSVISLVIWKIKTTIRDHYTPKVSHPKSHFFKPNVENVSTWKILMLPVEIFQMADPLWKTVPLLLPNVNMLIQKPSLPSYNYLTDRNENISIGRPKIVLFLTTSNWQLKQPSAVNNEQVNKLWSIHIIGY